MASSSILSPLPQHTFFSLPPPLYPPLLIVILNCGGGRVTSALPSLSVRTLLIFLQSWRQLFNKASMNPALSALFSFRRAAGEVMCASQIFMEDPGSPLAHSSTEREREMNSPNVVLMKIVPLIFLWMTILDFSGSEWVDGLNQWPFSYHLPLVIIKIPKYLISFTKGSCLTLTWPGLRNLIFSEQSCGFRLRDASSQCDTVGLRICCY